MESQNKAEIVEKQEEDNRKGQQENYFQYILQMLKEPEHILTEEEKGKHQFGLITMIAFLVLILLSNFIDVIDRFKYLDTLRFLGLDDYFGYTERTISYGIALVIVIVIYKNIAAKNGKNYNLNFFYEKMGAFLVLPSILLLVSIPLKLLNITIHDWFSQLSYTAFYLSIFLTSYLFVVRNNLKAAFIFLAGFYFVYRLIRLIL